jgi:hypothetical protein
MRNAKSAVFLALGAALAAAGASSVWAASHLWTINEIYSNADGTIQYIEMYNPSAPTEQNLTNKFVHSLATENRFVFPGPLTEDTTDRHILLATAGFASLPGAPPPDHVIVDNFFNLGGDEVRWWTYTFPDSELRYFVGQLPLDGIHSLHQDGNGFGVPGDATPTNFDGGSFEPPGVSGLVVDKLDGFPGGELLSVDFDGDACLGAAEFDIVYGFGTSLTDEDPVYAVGPASPDQCGFTLPKTWSGVPDPSSDASGFLWFVVVATDGVQTEGSWGGDSEGAERLGPAAGGASGQCGRTGKSLGNTCGQ